MSIKHVEARQVKHLYMLNTHSQTHNLLIEKINYNFILKQGK